MRIQRVAFVAVALFISACGDSGRAVERGSDPLYLQTSSGLTVIDSGAAHPTFRGFSSVPAGDWSTIVQTQTDGGSTNLIAVDPTTGKETWRRSLAGRLQAQVVSPDARYVALVPAAPYTAWPRRTEITVSGRRIREPVTVRLSGNFEPEAFSTDGKTLFVVEYLPADDPSRYQVRQLNIAKGKVRDVFSVDKELQEAMRGTARVQEMSSDGKRLYTLYTRRTKQGHQSFIHVLSLDEGWAHCIDLPHGFAMSGEAKTALKLNADDSLLYVADTEAGRVVEVDVQELAVLRERELDLSSDLPGAKMALDPEASTVYIGTGRRVVAASLDGLQETDSWEMDEAITGLQVGATSRRLYVGQPDTVTIIDLEIGERIETWDPPGVGSIERLGPTTPGLEGALVK